LEDSVQKFSTACFPRFRFRLQATVKWRRRRRRRREEEEETARLRIFWFTFYLGNIRVEVVHACACIRYVRAHATSCRRNTLNRIPPQTCWRHYSPPSWFLCLSQYFSLLSPSLSKSTSADVFHSTYGNATATHIAHENIAKACAQHSLPEVFL
jgi:hypothetical protein